MKKETKKKSKLWLWILLALLGLAIIGGVVAAFVLPGMFQQQGPSGPTAEAKLYWNLDRNLWLEEETGMSAREKAEDGYYHILYAFDGKVEEVKITDDKRLVNYLDSQDAICLAFDENGIVVDCAPASTYFTPAAKDLYTKRVQGNILQLNSSLAMNGMDMEFDISNIPVYEVAEGSEERGTLITPQWLDVVTVYNDLEGNPYAAYVTGHLAINAEIGWRVESSMYSASTGYKRVPDKDGVYTIPFAINGEIVDRYIKDYDLAVSIENQSMYTAYFALEYDEEGYIVDYENPSMALQGIQLCAAYNVDSIVDGTVTATRYMSGNNQGDSVTFTYDETCEIYQCCIGGCFDKHCGERVDSLREGDLVSVFTDLDGKPVLIYVAIRTVDYPAYYNLNRLYNSTLMETTRVPDEDGYYVFKMAVNGGVKEVRTKSKEVATQIDSTPNMVVGLKLSGSVIKKVVNLHCVSGRSIAFGGRFVTSYSHPILSVAPSSDITSVGNWIITSDCKIYTVSADYGVKQGSKSDIRVGDQVLGLMDARGELCYIYVQQRYNAGFKMGYSMSRKYNTETGTTRVPDAEGYYVYDVAYNGEVIQLKTKNKAMADFIDLQNAPVFGFKEKNGIFTDVCMATSAVPYGTKAYNYNYVESLSDGVLASWYMSNGVKTLGTARWKLTSKMKTYNVSKAYEDHPGEKTKVKVSDRIQAIVNAGTREIEYIFVMNRPIDSPIYWMVSRVAPRYVDGVLAGSNRVPDEDGYYVFDLLCDGKIKQYKTKDEMVAATVDTYTQGLGLKLKEGTNIIERVVGIADTKYPTTAIGNADVVSVKGSTINTKRCRLTSSDYGNELTLKLSSKVKIYNVSTYAEKFGAVDKLEKGDRIVAYSNLEGEIAYVFITKAAARDKGVWGHCDHCNKTVFWDSFSETFAADGHYYLPTDTERGTITFGSATDDAVYDQVFDLNGHSLKSTASAFTVYDKLTIIDSVGGGKVINGKGVSMGGTKQGGNIFVGEGGTFTLLSGTICNGAVGLAGVGSNISAYNGTVNIKGGTISGGVGYLGTAVYHSGTKGGINISGGKLAGSVFAEESKKITLSGAPVIEKLIVAPGNVVNLGALKKGAKITVKGDGIFTTESGDINTLKSYFVPANSKDTITVSGKALKYNNLSGEQVVPEPESPNKPLVLDKNGVGQCALCGEDVKWTALREGDVIGDMNPAHADTYNAKVFDTDQKHFHYYVAEDMTAGNGDFLFGWQGMSVCLHLNGKTLNVRSGFYGGNGSTINIYGLGKVHNLGNATKSYIAGYMFEGYTSNINIYGGEYTSDSNMIRGAGSAFKLSISDEAIINGNVKMDYGNVSISGGINVKRIALGETAKLTVSKFFKGNASLSVAAGLEEGNLIPEANAEVLGKYTGKLTYSDFRDIVYTNGRLKVVGEAPSPNDTLVLDDNDMGICYVCGEKVQWIALRGGDKIGDVHSDGQTVHYYVAEDMTAAEGNFQFLYDKSANVAVKASPTICLHLNDHILNVKGVIESGHGCVTNIMGNGTVLNGGSKELFQSYTATLNIYGGAYYGGDHPVYKTLGEGAKLNVMGDAKLYGNVELPYSALTLKENARIDNINLGNTTTQKDIDADGTPDDVTVYGKVTVGAGWNGKAKMTVDAANMDGKLLKAESGVAQGDFTGVLINQDGKKFVNSDGLLQLTSQTGSIPAAPAAPKAPAAATAPLPEGINDNLVLDSENKAMCVHCGEVVVWTALNDGETITNASNHYYVAEDMTAKAGSRLIYGADFPNRSICLHLNGKTLTTGSTGSAAIYCSNSATINIMGDGTVINGGTGLLFESYTCTVNLYGGNYNANVVMKIASSASAVSVLGDVQLNGLVQLTAGRTYFAHDASATKVDVSGSGKLQLANGWNGTMVISVADSLMEGDLVKKSAVELVGTINGTITMADGRTTVQEGDQLKVIGTVAPPAMPSVEDKLTFEADGKTAYCPVCKEDATWEVYTGQYADTVLSVSGTPRYHFYLTEDLEYTTYALQTYENICFHLNGHDVKPAANSTTSAKPFSCTQNFDLMGTGTVYGGKVVTANSGTIMAINGGKASGTLEVHSGTLQNSEGVTAPLLTIGANGGKIYIYGGTINGNGETIYTYGTNETNTTNANRGFAEVKISGGTVNGDLNIGFKNTNAIYVGGSSLTFSGGTVNGAVNMLNGSPMTIGGNATATSISIPADSKLTVAAGWSGTAAVTFASALDGDMVPAANGVAEGDFTGALTLSSGEKVVYDNGRLKVLVVAPPTFDPNAATNYCEACKTNVAWLPLREGEHFGGLTGQHYHYYLAEDMTSGTAQGGNYSGILPDLGEGTASQFKLCLQLNGKELTTQGVIYCGRQWQINIMGDGKVINGGSEHMFRVFTCDVNLYGGTYVANANTDMSVISMEGSNAKVYLHNDVEIQGKVTTGYGNLYVNDSAAVSNLEIITGKMTIAEGWAGSIKLTVPAADIVNDLIKTDRVVVGGDFTGTITMADGKTAVKEGTQLKVSAGTTPPAPSNEPVWGVFEPWNYGGRAYCEACGQKAGIKSWSVYDGSNYDESHVLSDPGTAHYHFYLDENKEYSTANYLNSYENICFHLNGHNITATGTACSSPIYTSQQLCIMGEGIVTGGSPTSADAGSVFNVNGGGASGSLEIYGGTYKKPEGSTNPLISVGSNGGKVYIYGGTFDVNGSSVAGERGNLLYVQGRTTNGTKPCLAAVEIHGGEFIGDGRIGSIGAGAEYDGAATLKILGGNINGVISVTNACEATLGGAATVKEISVAADSKLTVQADFAGKAAVSFESALVDNVVPVANVKVAGAFTGILSLPNGDALVADGETLKVPANNALLKDLQFTAGTQMAVCPLCGGDPVQWTDVTKDANKRIGFQANKGHLHLYLSEDMIASETLQFAEIEGNTTVCFHLNGHNLTLSSRFKVSSGVCNILGRGNVIFEGDCVNTNATNQTNYNSVGLEATSAATLNIYGGSYATAGAAKEAGKPMVSAIGANSKINLFDVTVFGGVKTGNGTVTLNASAVVDKLTVAAAGKLNVAGTFTGSVEASFASGLVADEVPAANGSSTGAFTGSVTLTDGTILIGEGGKLIKKPATT